MNAISCAASSRVERLLTQQPFLNVAGISMANNADVVLLEAARSPSTAAIVAVELGKLARQFRFSQDLMSILRCARRTAGLE